MDVVHQISLSATADDRRELEQLGVALPPPVEIPKGFVSFRVRESDPIWPRVSDWIRSYQPLDVVWTVFDKGELEAARWLVMRPTWHHGYPQPEDDFGYLKVIYDLSQYCPECGVGARQRAPFRMKREPKWHGRGILQLNWVFDEYFVIPEVWNTVFRPFGTDRMDVLDRKGDVLTTVTQLVVPDEVNLHVGDLPAERCHACGRSKYEPVVRGRLPAMVRPPAAHMARSAESFGSGRRAYHEVIVSNELARRIRAEGIRGVSFVPLEEG